VGRDTEQRVIAYSLFIVVGVAVLGWFAWIVTATEAGWVLSLVIVGSIVATLLSVPLSVVGIFLFERSSRDWALLARTVAIVLVLTVVAATTYTVFWTPSPALLTVGAVAALVSLWAILPLVIGAISAVGDRVSMIGVLLAWPPSNLLAMALFVAPAPSGIDFARYNALSLAEPVRSVLLLVIAATIIFGPTLLGRAADRLIRVTDHPQ